MGSTAVLEADPTSVPIPSVPLAGVAAAIAWLDVLLGRGLLRLVGATEHRELAVAVEAGSRFVRNLVGVLALLGLVWLTRATLRNTGLAFGIVRRLVIGALFGVFLPVVTIALVMPESRTTIVLVLVGILSGHALAMTYGGSAFAGEAPIEQRIACAFTATMAFASMSALLAQLATSFMGLEGGLELARNLRNVTEIAYFALPVSVALGLVLRGRERPRPRGLVLATLTALVVLGFVRWLSVRLPADTSMLLYGALRLEAIDAAPKLVYAALLGVGVGAGVLAAAGARPSDRALGVGLLLLAASGAGPRSPSSVAIMVLGAAILGLVPATADQSGSESAHSAS